MNYWPKCQPRTTTPPFGHPSEEGNGSRSATDNGIGYHIALPQSKTYPVCDAQNSPPFSEGWPAAGVVVAGKLLAKMPASALPPKNLFKSFKLLKRSLPRTQPTNQTESLALQSLGWITPSHRGRLFCCNRKTYWPKDQPPRIRTADNRPEAGLL